MLCIFDDRMEKTKIMGQEVWMEVEVSQASRNFGEG